MTQSSSPLLVSACLLGCSCRYDGGSCFQASLSRKLKRHLLFPVCPEFLAGLGVPRSPMEMRRMAGSWRLITREGLDVTRQVERSCHRIGMLASAMGVRTAVCKEGSPCCGVSRIRRNGEWTAGQGWLVRALIRQGIQVVEEKQALCRNTLSPSHPAAFKERR